MKVKLYPITLNSKLPKQYYKRKMIILVVERASNSENSCARN